MRDAEHDGCADRPEIPAIERRRVGDTEQKQLAGLELPGGGPELRMDLTDAIGQLEKQVQQQRIEELQPRFSELDVDEKRELLELLQARRR